MPKNRCKICRGAVCSFRNEPPQPQEADPAFVVSYRRQRLQDREIIRAILTGAIAQHESRGRLQPDDPMTIPISGGPTPHPQFSMGLASRPLPSSTAVFPRAQLEPTMQDAQPNFVGNSFCSCIILIELMSHCIGPVIELAPIISGRQPNHSSATSTHFPRG
ncbi:uncharacterized protein EI90DRAFT_3027151 [Cantharellus anzutake]|uniref:uncharacterized protein n=1 Tax=Cantharellus anzutake TaxID=1750568 RepID=UPI001904F76B|nr:uncharacterized protein EI90DRAFT_3027151 [Cantharellus anzutake]KAF8343801.1 hypothetical protein EI90DRAFT_3027151 [Cantharellus anzutake]